MPDRNRPNHWEKKPARGSSIIEALLVLVNRGMTIGTPDVVTAITMVRNGNWMFIALYEEEIIRIVTEAHSG